MSSELGVPSVVSEDDGGGGESGGSTMGASPRADLRVKLLVRWSVFKGKRCRKWEGRLSLSDFGFLKILQGLWHLMHKEDEDWETGLKNWGSELTEAMVNDFSFMSVWWCKIEGRFLVWLGFAEKNQFFFFFLTLSLNKIMGITLSFGLVETSSNYSSKSLVHV